MTPDAITALRHRTGLSLRAMQRVLGISYRSIHRYERGTRPIPMWYVVKLCTLALHMRPRVSPCPHCGGTGVQRS